MKKHNNSAKKSEPTTRRAPTRGPVSRDTKEVLAELVEKLKEKLNAKGVAVSAGEEHGRFWTVSGVAAMRVFPSEKTLYFSCQASANRSILT